jgi:predicted nucleotidyltransferase component of viral defense system
MPKIEILHTSTCNQLTMIFKDPNIILPNTLSLLQQVQADEFCQDFFLVGGTALALQMGHRFSIDLDLFSQKEFDNQLLEQHLQNKYNFTSDYIAKNTLKGFVTDVKIDFITHSYPLIHPIMIIDDIRIASLEDIGAMKLNAIAHNGTRQKDFFDLFFLLEKHPLHTFLEAYRFKYPQSNPLIALKALSYFEDIDFETEKPILRKKITFNTIKKRLVDAVKQPMRKYP